MHLNKTERVLFALTEEEKEKLCQKAEQAGKSVSAYIRMKIFEEVNDNGQRTGI